MLEAIVVFPVATLLSAVCLWGGMKLTSVEGSFGAMLAIAAVSSGLGLIPMVGWFLGIIAMFALICTLTDANFWPDAILMVLVAKFLSLGVGSFALAMMSGS